jgi:hypothetical protein
MHSDMTAPSNAAQPKTRRRCFSFSLRTVLIFVTLAGCGMAWLGFKVQEGRRQAAAVAAIEKLGGWVRYDYEFESQGGLVPNATPPGPAWLHSLLGDDFFRTVYSVGSRGFPVSGRQDRPIIDADLEFVKGLTTLKVLYLWGTKVTDADLSNLTGLTRLEELNLGNTNVSDAGLANLKGLIRLEELNLGNTNISDAGLDYLQGLTQLKQLYLNTTQVSDAGVEHLKGLTRLEALNLGNTHVSDAGLANLKGLTQLKVLFLNGTQVTDAGVAKLQKALPNCNILWH